MNSKKGLSIILTAIMVLSMFVALVPAASAVGAERILDVTGTLPSTVFIGETINITNLNTDLSQSGNDTVTFVKTQDPSQGHTFTVPANANSSTVGYAKRAITTGVAKEGQYNMTYVSSGGSSTTTSQIYFDTPDLGFKIEDETGTDTISSLTANGNFSIDITGNLPSDDRIDLVIKDKNGYQKSGDTNGSVFLNQTIDFLGNIVIYTQGWETGVYDLSIVTKSNYARGLDIGTSVQQLTIEKAGITITADKTDVTTKEDVLITITAPANKRVNVSVPSSKVADTHWLVGSGDLTTADQRTNFTVDNTGFNVGSDGKMTAVVEFNSSGSYKITAKALSSAGIIDTGIDSKDVTITVTKGNIQLSVPSSATIGEKVEVKGTTILPDNTNMDIKVENKYGNLVDQKNNTDIINGEFEWEWDTGSASAGSYKITAWWDVNGNNALDTTETIKDVTSVTLKSENIDVDVINPEVSTRDEIKIEGTTTGDPDEIVILLVGKDIAAYYEASVTDNSFDEEISASGWTAWYTESGQVSGVTTYTSGTYGIYAIHPMGDGQTLIETYGGTGGASMWAPAMQYIAARGWDGFQMLYLLQTSDDASASAEVTVAYPYLELDPVPDARPDDELVISGKTNRADETLFTVSISGHGVEETKNPEAVNGTIEATFDTTGWPVGTNYLVTVEDTDNTVSQQARFDVTECVPNIVISVDVPSSAKVGDEVTATATASNAGTCEGTETVSIKLDGTEVKSAELTLGAGESESVEYTFTATSAMIGTHTIEVGTQSKTLEITAAEPTQPPVSGEPTETPPPTEDVPPEEPGFEVVFAVTGLLAVAYLVLRRRRE